MTSRGSNRHLKAPPHSGELTHALDYFATEGRNRRLSLAKPKLLLICQPLIGHLKPGQSTVPYGIVVNLHISPSLIVDLTPDGSIQKPWGVYA